MSDDKNLRGPKDRSRVNVNEPYEARYWCLKFGCSTAQLRAAVHAVGIQVKDVEAYLKSHG